VKIGAALTSGVNDALVQPAAWLDPGAAHELKVGAPDVLHRDAAVDQGCGADGREHAGKGGRRHRGVVLGPSDQDAYVFGPPPFNQDTHVLGETELIRHNSDAPHIRC